MPPLIGSNENEPFLESPTAPCRSHSTRRPKTSRKPGILLGISPRAIIEVCADSGDEDESLEQQGLSRVPTNSQCHRPTTRQCIHGRREMEHKFDAKYHPMDDIVRPANARLHRIRWGLSPPSTSNSKSAAVRSSRGGLSPALASPPRKRTKVQPCDGSRRSQRLSTQKRPDYRTSRHPQDVQLREVLGKQFRLTRTGPRRGKSRLSPETVALSDDNQILTSDDDLVSRKSQPEELWSDEERDKSAGRDANDTHKKQGEFGAVSASESEPEAIAEDDVDTETIDCAIEGAIDAIAKDYGIQVMHDIVEATADKGRPDMDDEASLNAARESDSDVLDDYPPETDDSEQAHAAHTIESFSSDVSVGQPRNTAHSRMIQVYEDPQGQHSRSIASGRQLSENIIVDKWNRKRKPLLEVKQSALDSPVRRAHTELQAVISSDGPPTSRLLSDLSPPRIQFPTPISLAFSSGQPLPPSSLSSQREHRFRDALGLFETSLSQPVTHNTIMNRSASRSSSTIGKHSRGQGTSPTRSAKHIVEPGSDSHSYSENPTSADESSGYDAADFGIPQKN